MNKWGKIALILIPIIGGVIYLYSVDSQDLMDRYIYENKPTLLKTVFFLKRPNPNKGIHYLPLHTAIKRGHDEILDILLTHPKLI